MFNHIILNNENYSKHKKKKQMRKTTTLSHLHYKQMHWYPAFTD